MSRSQTNRKVTGWGEVSALVPAAAEELAKALFALLDGENPTRIEHLWQKMYRAHRDMRGGPFMSHTIAGIDMALWDITGKLWGVPVYRLLGGPCRDRVRVYPTAKAEKVPPHGVYEHSGRPSDIQRMVDAIKAARERVGPGRHGHVRRPLRRAAGHADPARLGHQGVRRAVHRGAGGAGQHRGVQATEGRRSTSPWPRASATARSGISCRTFTSGPSTCSSPTWRTAAGSRR